MQRKLGLNFEELKYSQRLMIQEKGQRKSNLKIVGKLEGCDIMVVNGKRDFVEGTRGRILWNDVIGLSKVIINYGY